jgi:uncharacterized membrane protein
MTLLIVGLIIFLGMHSFTIFRDGRAALIARVGATAYKGLYAVVSGVGLIVIIIGYRSYRQAGPIPVWNPPDFDRHITFLLMLFAFIFIASTYGQSHIRKVIKHPMLTGVKTWAVAHLLVRGDLGSILLFGSFLIWAVLARISIKRRAEVGPTFIANWTSDLIAIVVAVVVYFAFLLWLHRWLIGVPLLPRSMGS